MVCGASCGVGVVCGASCGVGVVCGASCGVGVVCGLGVVCGASCGVVVVVHGALHTGTVVVVVVHGALHTGTVVVVVVHGALHSTFNLVGILDGEVIVIEKSAATFKPVSSTKAITRHTFVFIAAHSLSLCTIVDVTGGFSSAKDALA